jgi:hypothetical protein
MNPSHPFSLRIFVADGDPDGLRIVERSNWIGKGLMFPRSLLPTVKQRDEFSQTGVYILIGPREDGDGDQIYIGEGDPVKSRFEDHYAKKDFWNRGVFFISTGNPLNKAHVQFLESRLIARAIESKRLPIDNRNQPAESSLSEADRADMEVFLDHLFGILPVLGINAFEQPIRSKVEHRDLYSINAKGIQAKGFESSQGFTVQSGSSAVVGEAPSMAVHVHGMYELRQQLKKLEVLKDMGGSLQFTQDYSFSSPSTAAAVVLGRSANGRVEWKNSRGETLKSVQESTASN